VTVYPIHIDQGWTTYGALNVLKWRIKIQVIVIKKISEPLQHLLSLLLRTNIIALTGHPLATSVLWFSEREKEQPEERDLWCDKRRL